MLVETELAGINYLRDKLADKRLRCLTRYTYYEQKNSKADFGAVIPDKLKQAYLSVLGWCTKSVDSIADRLVFRGFSDDNFNMQGIYDLNNTDVLIDSAIRGALITSCDFIYLSTDENGTVRMQVIDGSNATGIIDPITNMLKEGYAVLERDDLDNPLIEAYFVKGNTTFYYNYNRSKTVVSIDNKAPYPLLVPIIYKPDSRRPFGHSRISRSCMDIVNKARNTITRGEVSAEFYSFPQKYVTGLSQDAEPLDKWKATISSLLQFDKDEDGDHPILGQFSQQSMEPFISQIKMYAALFGGETGLTLDDLGFASGNPSSYEAIKAAHETLRAQARAAQRSFGVGFINAGYLGCCLRDNVEYKREEIYRTRVMWEPLFEADASALSGLGDAFIKLQQAFPNYVTEEKLKDLTGL